MDFGLPLERPGAGEREFALENGLLRFCAWFDAMVCSDQIATHEMYNVCYEAKQLRAICGLQ